jgi:molybdopterin-guanine dinucleotide biosynthesis protein A
MIPIPCVILSGGASRRMGEDKSLLPFQNCNTLIEYQHNKLSKIFSTVYISSKTNKFSFNANILYDNSQEVHSPMIALKSILDNIQEEKIFITTVDVPFIKKDTFNLIAEKSINYKITVAQDSTHTHNLCGVFSKSLLPIITELLNNNIHKISTLIEASNSFHKILFENTEQFSNINTKDDYNKYNL